MARGKPTKAEITNQLEELVQGVLAEHLGTSVSAILATQLVRGATAGGELDVTPIANEWIEARVGPQIVWLDENDYTRALTRALPQALKFAGADFGSSRQRDLGQLWTDTARGFLGEIAFQKFMFSRLNLTVLPDTSIDLPINDYIPSDIIYVKDPETGLEGKPNYNISIKTGKFNARWMDEYSARKIDKVDVFTFVRLGIIREHFVSFLKHISFIRDKLFPRAIELEEITDSKHEQILWDMVPNFVPIPAYISGFLETDQLNLPVHEITMKKTGGKSPHIEISRGVGVFTMEALRQLPEYQLLDPAGTMYAEIEGIQSIINDSPHFYSHTGSFKYTEEDWQRFKSVLLRKVAGG